MRGTRKSASTKTKTTNKMVKKNIGSIPSKLTINQSVEGETIELKVERIVNNKEPVKDGAPMIYTARQEGINKAYDIRTDRWEVAIDASTAVAKSYKGKREDRAAARRGENKPKEDGKPESIQGKPASGTDKSN